MGARSDLAVAVVSIGAFLLGARRLAGGIAAGYGVWALTQRRYAVAGATSVIGGSFLLWPEWPEGLGGAVEKKIDAGAPPPQLGGQQPPVYYTKGGVGVDIGGGWTMLDVSASQSGAGKAMLAKGLPSGASAPLVLQSKGAAPVVYYVSVLNRMQDGSYAGQWKVQPPGGPQAIDFDASNVLL